MREATISRKTKETNIIVKLNLDGKGEARINTPIPFFNHMLESLAKHSMIDLNVEAEGDVQVDFHHTVEDVGIVLGKAIGLALGEKQGIRRFGFGFAPMDETLTRAVIDISGRPGFVFNGVLPREKVGNFDTELTTEFFKAVAFNVPIALHLKIEYATNAHHTIESLFKSFALALRMAVEIDPRRRDSVPSTKGSL